jgi:hypothetical protein
MENRSPAMRDLGITGWRGAAILAVQAWGFVEIVSLTLRLLAVMLIWIKGPLSEMMSKDWGFYNGDVMFQVLQLMLNPIAQVDIVRLLVFPAAGAFGLFIALAGYAEMHHWLANED